MRIIIDLDGVICPIKLPNQTYGELKPIYGSIKKIKKLKKEGHHIIINTARNMATQKSNIGLVNKNITLITLKWLEKYKIEFDEIYFGKPNGDVYIDDRALKFISWETITTKNLEKEFKK